MHAGRDLYVDLYFVFKTHFENKHFLYQVFSIILTYMCKAYRMCSGLQI